MADAFDETFEKAAPTPTPEPTPAPVAAAEPPKPEPIPVPEPAKPEHVGLTGPALAAVLDEREKRQRVERELADLRSKQTPSKVPSIQDDPEAYGQYLAEETRRVAINSRFESSEIYATEKHGEPAVKAAMDWGMQRAEASPAFAAEYIKQKHPVDWIVRQHKEDGQLSEMRADEIAFARKLALKHGLIPDPATPPALTADPVAPPQPAPPIKPAPPPRSLASAPSAGGQHTIPTGPGAAFDVVFPR